VYVDQFISGFLASLTGLDLKAQTIFSS